MKTAPMGGTAVPALALAVSNADGLGMLVLWRADIDTGERRPCVESEVGPAPSCARLLTTPDRSFGGWPNDRLGRRFADVAGWSALPTISALRLSASQIARVLISIMA